MARTDRWKNLALLAGTIVLFGLVAELALRLLWKNGQYALRVYQSAPYLFEIKYWKTWHYRNAHVHFIKDCLDVSYSTNSFGMRGKEIDADGGSRREAIALLGDSYVEGYAVNDDETMGFCLEPLLNHKYQVMNFGVSGGFGTIHELALYHNYVRHFNPACVVLFFVNYNDLYDNVNAVSEGLINNQLEITYPVSSNFEEIQSALAQQNSRAPASEVGNTPYLFRFLPRSLRVAGESVQYWWNIRTDFNDALINVYTEPETDAVKKGWIITQRSLARLKLLAAENGSKLLVVDLADPYQIDVHWLKIASLKSGKEKTVDPRHPNKRLQEICEGLHISYYDTYAEVVSYIGMRRMRFPYLSCACDRHYNKEGNSLIAKLVAQKLRALFDIG